MASASCSLLTFTLAILVLSVSSVLSHLLGCASKFNFSHPALFARNSLWLQKAPIAILSRLPKLYTPFVYCAHCAVFRGCWWCTVKSRLVCRRWHLLLHRAKGLKFTKYFLITKKNKKNNSSMISLPNKYYHGRHVSTCLLYLDGRWRSTWQPNPLVPSGRHTLAQWPRGKLSVSFLMVLCLFLYFCSLQKRHVPSRSLNSWVFYVLLCLMFPQ